MSTLWLAHGHATVDLIAHFDFYGIRLAGVLHPLDQEPRRLDTAALVVEVGGRRNGRRKTPLWSYDFTTTGPQAMDPHKTDANNIIGRRTTSILFFLSIITYHPFQQLTVSKNINSKFGAQIPIPLSPFLTTRVFGS